MCSILNDIIDRLASDRNQHIKTAHEIGEKPDKSYDSLIAILDNTRAQIRKKSDDLWNEAESLSDKYDSGFENLANAVLELAARDYESALCGSYGSDSHKFLIEKFANSGAEAYTD